MSDPASAGPSLRLMRDADVGPVDLLVHQAFLDLSRRLGQPSAEEHRTEEDIGVQHHRLRHLLATDPKGAWVADTGEGPVGCALALRRDGFWGLSLFAVAPGRQEAGVGRRLLEAALAYGDGCTRWMIISSPDSRAIRRYALAGFALWPTLRASGMVVRDALRDAPGVREGGADDVGLTVAVDRQVRGAPHGRDISAALEAGFRLLVIGHRGYVLHRDGAIVLLAATDEAAARLLLWAALAAVPEGTEARLFWIAAGQDWAVEIVLAAGLAVSPAGPICVRGFDPMPYYLPNGAFL